MDASGGVRPCYLGALREGKAMARKKKNSRTKRAMSDPLPTSCDPYMEMWLSLSPYERLRRSWRLRRFIKDLEAVHDAKYLPEL